MICPVSRLKYSTVSNNSNVTNSTLDSTEVDHNSIVTTSTLKRCIVHNAIVKNIIADDFYFKGICIVSYNDIYTWINDDHIMFLYDHETCKVYTKKPNKNNEISKNVRYSKISSGTYIGKLNKKSIHIVWNVNKKEPVDIKIEYYF